jgi:hypothetical protein
MNSCDILDYNSYKYQLFGLFIRYCNYCLLKSMHYNYNYNSFCIHTHDDYAF